MLTELGEVTGYMHPGYAESLAEFGRPRQLPRSGGWILERRIPGFPYQDAMGCYPLFVCQDWSQLHADLSDIGNDLVNLSLVTDPFGRYDISYLRNCFKDMVRPFKEHFVVDLSNSLDTFVSSHHRRNAHKALQRVQVEYCYDASEAINDWIPLYVSLIKRHNINGISAFSRASFEKQLRLPGMVALRALHKGSNVGMLLWYIQGEVAFYHLGAFSPTGYELGGAFALFWTALERFAATGVRWLNLGAGAGVQCNGEDGLSRFKRGWSTGTRPAYFCGRIFDHAKYSEIMRGQSIAVTDYFPAYRKGEFG